MKRPELLVGNMGLNETLLFKHEQGIDFLNPICDFEPILRLAAQLGIY